VADGLDIVEFVPDGLEPHGDEDLPTPRARSRFAGPRLWHAAVAVAVLGGILVADAPARPRPPAASVPYLYRGDSHCPMGIRCQVETGPRRGLWASYNRLFVDTTATGGGVWYEAGSGVVCDTCPRGILRRGRAVRSTRCSGGRAKPGLRSFPEPGQRPWGDAGAFADPDGHVWMVRSEVSTS